MKLVKHATGGFVKERLKLVGAPKTGEKLTRGQLYRMRLLEACRKEVAQRKAEKEAK